MHDALEERFETFLPRVVDATTLSGIGRVFVESARPEVLMLQPIQSLGRPDLAQP